MKKFIKVAGVSLAILGASLSFAAEAAQKIGYVSTGSIMAEMAKRTNLSQKLRNEFKTRVAEIKRLEKQLRANVEKLQRDAKVMSDAARTKLERDIQSQNSNLQLKASNLREDQAKRGSAEQRKLLERLQSTVKTIAAKQGYDMVLDRNAVIFGNAKDDLSDEVLKAMR